MACLISFYDVVYRPVTIWRLSEKYIVASHYMQYNGGAAITRRMRLWRRGEYVLFTRRGRPDAQLYAIMAYHRFYYSGSKLAFIAIMRQKRLE